VKTATEVSTIWNQLAEAIYLKNSPTAEVKLSEDVSFSFGRFQRSDGLPEIARPVAGEEGFIAALQLKDNTFYRAILRQEEGIEWFLSYRGS
jgi:AraC family transcriptional regulator